MSDPFLLESEAEQDNLPNDPFMIQSSFMGEPAVIDGHSDFELPSDMMRDDESPPTIRTAPGSPGIENPVQRKGKFAKTAGKGKLKKKLACARPSAEMKVPEAAPLEDRLVSYLEDQMASVTQDFLEELRCEMDRACTLPSHLDTFIDEVIDAVRSTAVTASGVNLEDVSGELNRQFQILQLLPRGEPCDAPVVPSYRSIDAAKTAFLETGNGILEGLVVDRSRSRVEAASLEKRRRVLDKARVTLEARQMVIDEATTVVEVRLERLKARRSALHERRLAKLVNDNAEMFKASTMTDEEAGDELLTLIRDFSPQHRLNECEYVKSEVVGFGRDVRFAGDSLQFCVKDFASLKNGWKTKRENQANVLT